MKTYYLSFTIEYLWDKMDRKLKASRGAEWLLCYQKYCSKYVTKLLDRFCNPVYQ